MANYLDSRATDALRRVVDTGSYLAEDRLLARDGLRSGLESLNPIESFRATESVERVFRGSRLAEDLVHADQVLTSILGPAPYAGSRMEQFCGGVSGGGGGISGGGGGIS